MIKHFQWILMVLLFAGLLPSGSIFAHDKSQNNKVPQEFRGQLSGAMEEYFELESAIFDENVKIAAEKAALLKKAFEALKADALTSTQQAQWQKEILTLEQAVVGLVSGKEIKEQRSGFLAISNVLIEIVKKFGPLNYDTFLLHCPMAVESGGHWLSNTKDIANPYFGESMSGCGTLVETFAKTTD